MPDIHADEPEARKLDQLGFSDSGGSAQCQEVDEGGLLLDGLAVPEHRRDKGPG